MRSHPVPDGSGIRPPHAKSPCLDICSLGETDLIEGDSNLHGPPPFCDPGGGIPNGIPGEILYVSPYIYTVGIRLYAKGIDPELESATLVIEKIDDDPDMIILYQCLHGIPVHEVGPYLRRIGIITPVCHVQIILVKSHQEIRIHRSRDVVSRTPLIHDFDGFNLCPGRFIQDTVNFDIFLCSFCGVVGMIRCTAKFGLGKHRTG